MNLEEIIIEIIKEKLISGDEFDKNDYQEIYNRCELYNLLLRNKILKNINKANVQHEILIKLEIIKRNDSKKPYMIQVFESNMPDNFKIICLNKINQIKFDHCNSQKLVHWVESFLKLPFNCFFIFIHGFIQLASKIIITFTYFHH